jgi:HTH-type transcriptional repressor of NAD biosynthesis genes
MSKIGFVFGKFLPFHLGHVHLIDAARRQCDRIVVLVCASEQEPMSLSLRMGWLQAYYRHDDQVSIEGMLYHESELPNTSVSSRSVSQLWAARFQKLVPSATHIFSSEPYGTFVAEYMGIKSVQVDLDREAVPISATAIREAPLRHWAYLPEVVRPHFVQKVILLGTESTGKSTLCERLAAAFATNWVPEAGRDIVPETRACRWEDLEAIVGEQTHRIETALPSSNRFLFIDTDWHITRSYGQFLFGRELAVSDEVKAQQAGHHAFFLTQDAPFVQDGTRLSRSARDRLEASHLATLQASGIAPVLVRGDWEARFSQIKTRLEEEL